jgi:hypothetical protein
MKFEVKKVNRNITNEELLADVKNIASIYGFTTMSQDVYVQYGKFHPSTLLSTLWKLVQSLRIM